MQLANPHLNPDVLICVRQLLLLVLEFLLVFFVFHMYRIGFFFALAALLWLNFLEMLPSVKWQSAIDSIIEIHFLLPSFAYR